MDDSKFLSSSQASESAIQNVWDSLQDITLNGQYTRLLEKLPDIDFSELGTENSVNVECETFEFDPSVFELESFPAESTIDSSDLLSVIGADKIASQTKATSEKIVQLTNELPANNNWPGGYSFQISFDTSHEKTTKSSAWTFAESLDKLYVNISCACPIRFYTSTQPPNNSVIRITPIFCRPAHATDIVRRCLVHSSPTELSNINFPHPESFVRVESPKADYQTDPVTLRQSVVVPFNKPEVGIEFVPYLIKFMCLSSCSGTLERRPLQVIFSLENGNQCIGRRTIQLKSCRCPGRDRKNEEKAENRRKDTPKSSDRLLMTRTTSKEFISLAPIVKKPRLEDEKEFTIKVKSRELYEILIKMKECYELSEKVSPDVAREYFEKERKQYPERSVVVPQIKEPNAVPSMNKIISIPVNASIKNEDELAVLSWLKEIHMEAYYHIFKKEGYKDLMSLNTLTLEKLKQLGIGEGHRDTIISSLNLLSPNSSFTIPLSQGSTQSFTTSSQGSTTSQKNRRFRIRRFKVIQHSSIGEDHDYI